MLLLGECWLCLKKIKEKANDISKFFCSFILIICNSFYFIIKTAKDKEYRYGFYSGLTLGLAHWFRPIGMIFLLTFIFYIIFNKNKFPEKKPIKTLFIVVITYLTVLSPIAIYSYNNNWM